MHHHHNHHREARVAVSEQDHITRSRNNSRSRQIERATLLPPQRVSSPETVSATDAEEQSSMSQDDTVSNFSLRDSTVLARQVILNHHFVEANHRSSSIHQTGCSPPPPSTYTTSLHIPSTVSHRKLSGILEFSLPVATQTSNTRNDVSPISPLPASCPTSAHSIAHRPNHHHQQQKNSKLLLSAPQSTRLRYMAPLNASAFGEADDEPETRRIGDANSAYNSEAEEESGEGHPTRSSGCSPNGHSIRSPSCSPNGHSIRSPVCSPPRRENVETKRALYESGEHGVGKKVEFTRIPMRNQFVVDGSGVRRPSPSQRLSGNDSNVVSKSGSFSIPGRTPHVTQLRPCPRTPSPGGFASRRPDLSPRSLVSTTSMLSLDGRPPSRIPRPIQKIPRTSQPPPPIAPSPVVPYEIRYSVFNVFTIVMTSGSDDRADRLHDQLSSATVAKETVIEALSRCEVDMRRSYVHPIIKKIQTYDPVKISTKRSELISAVVAIEEPRVMRTLPSVTQRGAAERTDKHIITLTEFRDAVRVLEPVAPTNNRLVPKPVNADRVAAIQPPADRATGRVGTSSQKIISMIPPVILANARVKKQKRSKSVQSKVQHSVKPSVRHAVQCSVQPVFQSSVHPGVHSSLPAMLQRPVKPVAVKPPVQSVAQSLNVVLPTVRPGGKSSSLMSDIVEVSFTDLDKKAFQPRPLTTTSKTTKTRNAVKDAGGRTWKPASTDSSSEGILTTASRSALKAIVKAILANTGVRLRERSSPDRTMAHHHHHTHAKTSSSALLPTVPASQRKNWSLDEVIRPTMSKASSASRHARTEPHAGESFVGERTPLGSSVTQVFCKHRKERQLSHHHQHHHHNNNNEPPYPADGDENSMSWSKALYAKTLYFKNEMENEQKQKNASNATSNATGYAMSNATGYAASNAVSYAASNAVSSVRALSTATDDPITERFGHNDRNFGHSHFRSIGMMSDRDRHSDNMSSSNSASAKKVDDAFSSLEQTVSSFLVTQYCRIHPAPQRSS